MEPYSPWQNIAKGVIKILKYTAKCIRIQRRVPKLICNFGLVWEAEIYSRTSEKDGKPYGNIDR